MCGRYHIDEQTLKINKPQNAQWGEIRPSDLAPVLAGREGRLCVLWQRWGYPGVQPGKVIFNARVESVLEKRMFQNGIHYHRVVIPAAWFYEWNKAREKIKFLKEDAPVLFLAGFYDYFDGEARFVILTTQANESMERVHDRMPLILEESQVHDWIFQEDAVKELLRLRPSLLKKQAEYEQQTLF